MSPRFDWKNGSQLKNDFASGELVLVFLSAENFRLYVGQTDGSLRSQSGHEPISGDEILRFASFEPFENEV